MDYAALYDENATQKERVACYQRMINEGVAWRMEGHVGRTAMRLIEDGQCMLGKQDQQDYWGNNVPSRYDVKPGTKGSFKYVAELAGESHARSMAKL
jgi:hypothetical protein